MFVCFHQHLYRTSLCPLYRSLRSAMAFYKHVNIGKHYGPWITYLSSYDIAVFYRKGSDNTAADFLSRRNYSESDLHTILSEPDVLINAGKAKPCVIDRVTQSDAVDSVTLAHHLNFRDIWTDQLVLIAAVQHSKRSVIMLFSHCQQTGYWSNNLVTILHTLRSISPNQLLKWTWANNPKAPNVCGCMPTTSSLTKASCCAYHPNHFRNTHHQPRQHHVR
jgi:hypothetical protein